MNAVTLIGNTAYQFLIMQVIPGISWLNYFYIALFVLAIVFVLSMIKK